MNSKSSTETAADLPETVEVARIRSPHGVRGAMALAVLTDVEGRLEEGSELLLVSAAGERRPVRIAFSRPHKTGRVIRLEGVDTPEEAAALRGDVLEVPRSQVPPAEDGSYYQFELMGCRCRDKARGSLGVVSDLIEDGGGLLLEVEGDEMSVLVPFVAEFVVEVNVAAREIELDLPDGLIEECAFRR